MDTIRAVLDTIVVAVVIPVVAWVVFVCGLVVLLTVTTGRLPAFLDSYNTGRRRPTRWASQGSC